MGSGFWAEQWTPEGLVRRAYRKLAGKKKVAAVGISGTGDGDASISC